MMERYRWGIFLVNLDPVVGSEQGRTRPVLTISDEEISRILSVVNVLPITSRKPGRRVYPNEVLLPAGEHGLKVDSIVLCHQIRTVDKKRLIRKMGSVETAASRAEIIQALCFQLAIDEEP